MPEGSQWVDARVWGEDPAPDPQMVQVGGIWVPFRPW